MESNFMLKRYNLEKFVAISAEYSTRSAAVYQHCMVHTGWGSYS